MNGKVNTQKNSIRLIIENAIPWLVLALLFTYTYAKFFMHPYGFRFDSNGKVLFVFVKEQEPTLMTGDRILQVGEVQWQEFHDNLLKTFFEGAKPGDIVPIKVERDSQTLNIPWIYPGLNQNEFLEQFFSEWPLAYIFWLAGTLTLLLARPHDDRWLLLSAFNFLTAIWLTVGSGVAFFHIWYSGLVLRMAVWLCAPVYLHLHWVFPRPLGKLSPWLTGSIYAVFLALVIAQVFQVLPYSSYLLGFIIAIGGSASLLVAHVVRQPKTRRDLRLLFIVALAAMMPAIVWGIVDIFVVPLRIGGYSILAGALLSLPLIPLVYLYAAYRRQLGGFELRANQFISVYSFVILLGTVVVPLITLAEHLLDFPEKALIIGIASSILTSAACLWGFPAFQNFVERRWLGISLPSKHLQEIYAARITTSTSLPNLIHILGDEIIPSLLVRQFVFLRFDKNSTKTLLSIGMEEQIYEGDNIADLIHVGEADPDQLPKIDPHLTWVRLALPLSVGDELLGIWLFGSRDPDDTYSQMEIPVLQSLADQTAIALSNILQTQRLNALYQADINHYEEERLHLALDLHDSVLNQMAAILMTVDTQSLPSSFQRGYEELTQRLREIVSDLRPPMLNYGLKPAIEELADNLMERSVDTVSIVVNVQADEQRYPENIERNVYRIVQQTCENSLRHGKARKISIDGSLNDQEIELRIEDNGIGFDIKQGFELDDLLANKHFGLAGMIERGMLIGGSVNIDSAPNTGTRIRLTWSADHA